jgi:cytochrome c oxidase assembly factor CtaG/polyferredoxin
MSSTFEAILRSWPVEPAITVALALAAGVYLRGWLELHRRNPRRWQVAQPLAFVGGLLVLFLAVGSPIEPFGALLLQVHMLQHLLLMMAAPPLIWLGDPLFPFLMGLPGPIRTYWAIPLWKSGLLRQLFTSLTHPICAWLLFAAATWFWHLPQTYDLALRFDGWHYLQHGFFLATALLFWYPVVRPFPSRPSYSEWILVPYLILADVQNTLLSAILTFADQPLYRFYVERPRLWNLSPLDDQAAAGVLMWVPGSIVFLVPLFVVVVRLLFSGDPRPRRAPILRRPAARQSPVVSCQLPDHAPRTTPYTLHTARHAFDLVRMPLLGRFLRWRYARLSLQIPFLLLAVLIVFDGLRGPPIAAENLAGVLPWIHWRGIVVLGLLAAGNVVCMACPFMLPRALARRLGRASFAWPAWLRNKWLAVVLLIVFFWAYEALALWDSPWWTAWIVLAYFATALVIDGCFRGASFCKYVCPIGQFNFVQSLISPWEVAVRAPDTCASCQTKDCIRGRDEIPGCQMHLYQPRKSSNMDCTFCLDCIHACPHDNVGIQIQLPGNGLWRDPLRSGLGRFSRRPDLAALIVVLVFGAFVNAAGMVGPVLEWEDRVAFQAGLASRFCAKTAIYASGLLLLPAFLVGASALLCRWLGRLKAPLRFVATRFSYALVPIGFSMWLAHYGFHLVASFGSIFVAAGRFAHDWGWTNLPDPRWACDCCAPVAHWLPRMEILFLDFGVLGSLYVAYRIALSWSDRGPRILAILWPWALLIMLLFAAGVWIVLQPMQMRGTLSAG